MLEDELTPTRRQFPRIPTENVVLIHRMGPEEQREMATARQMGPGGLMINSIESLGVDSYLRLMLTIDHEVIEAIGRVVWEKPAKQGGFDVGVAFVSIDAAHADRIMTEMVQANPG